jgi:hypothetical protein
VTDLYRTVAARPRPDVRILELKPTGAGSFVEFSASIQNHGTKPCRCGISASVGDRPVDCVPAIVDLGVNEPPKRIAIRVPRALGDRVEELIMQVNDGKRMTSRTWNERWSGPPRTEARTERASRRR